MLNQSGGFIQPYAEHFGSALRSIDIVLIGGLLWLLAFLFGMQWHGYFTIAAFLSMITYVVTAEITGLYGSWRFSYILQEVRLVFLTWLSVIFVLLIFAYATKTSSIYSRRVLLSWMLLTPVILSAFRLLLRQFLHSVRRTERNIKTAVMIGAGEQAIPVVYEIHRLKWFGLKLLGYFDDFAPLGTQPVSEYPELILGKQTDIVSYVNENLVDMVFVALPMQQESTIQSLVQKLSDTTVQTYIVPDFFISNLLNTRWGYIGNMPVLSIHDRPFKSVDGWVKRIEDIVISLLIMSVIAIPMLIIAIIIKITSPGPVIYKQKRYGVSGEKIDVLKFRSMTVCEEGDAIRQAQKNDLRVTPFGRLLRKTSLDELPQFVNVLQGTMSVVGPRPHPVILNEKFRREISGYTLRHTIKPGITGWAQVNGWRGETDTSEKMENRIDHDLWYIRNWTLWLDVKIILLTMLNGFNNKQVY